jgi:hypothetical protein
MTILIELWRLPDGQVEARLAGAAWGWTAPTVEAARDLLVRSIWFRPNAWWLG